jgi:hypothetical protein
MHTLIHPLIPYTMPLSNINHTEVLIYDFALYHAIEYLDKELTRLSDISPDRELMTKDAILKLDKMDLTLRYLTELREKMQVSS